MKNRFHNWSDIRVFLAVMAEGSTLAASKALDMAQPTVARRIEALEHALNLKLFEKDTRGFHPTREATALHDRALIVAKAIDDLSDTAAMQSAKTTRVIRFAAAAGMFSEPLLDIFDAFLETQTNLTYELINDKSYIDLGAGQADVVARATSMPIEDESLICRKIFDIESSLYAAPSYVARHGTPTSEDDFSGHRFIVYKGENIPKRINAWLLARINPDQIVMTCSDVISMVTALQSGRAIGPVPDGIIFDGDSLKPCFPAPKDTHATLWMLANKESYTRPEVKDFMAFAVPRIRKTFQPK